jgi:hypothetical protein
MKDGMVRAVTEEEYRKEQCRKALQWLKQEGIENTTVSIPPKRLAMLLVRYTDEVRHASVLSVEQQEFSKRLPMGMGIASVIEVERLVGRVRGAFNEVSGMEQSSMSMCPQYIHDQACARYEKIIPALLLDLAAALGKKIVVESEPSLDGEES